MKRGRHKVVIEGLCPVPLARQLEKASLDSLPKAVELRAAKAALAALERDIVRQSKDLPAQERETMAAESLAAINKQTHVNFEWRVFVRRPDDWVEPPCPHSMEQKNLGLFSKEDFRSIAMYHLGGLADVGAVHPIVPEPKGEGLAAAAALTSWRSRLPIDDPELGSPDPELSPTKLPPGLAEQMFSAVSVWVAEIENLERLSPAARLCLALIGLKGVLGDGAPFTELSVRRSEQSRLQRAAFDAAGRGLCVSLMDTKSMAELATRFLDGSMPREPSDYLQRLSDVLVEADRHCQDAIVAISLGGVRKIDRGVNPGAAEASLAWDVRIQRTQEQLARVRWWLREPRLVVEEDLRGIRETGDWLEQAIAELNAAERLSQTLGEQSDDDKQLAGVGESDQSVLLAAKKTQPDKSKQLSRTMRAAGESLEWAIVTNPAFEHLANEGGDALLPIHAWLKDQECPCYPLSKDGKETLPSAQTWLRYIRGYRRMTWKSAKPPKARAPDGKSVVRVEEI